MDWSFVVVAVVDCRHLLLIKESSNTSLLDSRTSPVQLVDRVFLFRSTRDSVEHVYRAPPHSHTRDSADERVGYG